jgi:signal transduction histidine kinase
MSKVRVEKSLSFTSWVTAAAVRKGSVNLRSHTFKLCLTLIYLSLTFIACDEQDAKPIHSSPVNRIDSLDAVIRSTPYRKLHQIWPALHDEVDWSTETWKELPQEVLIQLAAGLIDKQDRSKTAEVMNVLFQLNLRPKIEAQALRLLALQQYQLGDYNANLHTLHKIEQIDSSEQDTVSWVTTVLNQASAKHSLGDYASGVKSCNKAIELSENLNNDSLKTIATNHLANVLIMLDSLDEAKDVLLSQKSYTLSKEQAFLIDLNLAVIEDHRGNHENAIALYNNLLKQARASGDSSDVQNLLYNLAYAYYEMGDCDKAFLYFDKYYFLVSEFEDAAFKIKLIDAQTKYESLKKEQKIKALEDQRKQQEKQLLYLVLISVLIAMIAVLSVITLRNKSINQRLKFDVAMKRLQHENEIASLNATLSGIEQERKRIAMDLHDGVGVLTSTVILLISSLTKKIENVQQQTKLQDIISMLKQMASDIRKISHALMPTELDKLGLKIALEQLFASSSKASNLSFSVVIEDEINNLKDDAKVMLFRISQELVNNAIKHSSAKKVEFRMVKVQDKIHLAYTDDGVGYNLEQMKNEGKGLQSIRSRVQYLKGKFEVKSAPGQGMVVQISIPHEKV